MIQVMESFEYYPYIVIGDFPEYRDFERKKLGCLKKFSNDFLVKLIFWVFQLGF